MVRKLLVVLGSVLSLLGLVMVSPIPGSAFALALGIAILICSSERAAQCLRYFRSKPSAPNKAFSWLENERTAP